MKKLICILISILLLSSSCANTTPEKISLGLWAKASLLRNSEAIIGGWIKHEGENSKASTTFSFGKSNYKTVSIVTKEGWATGYPLQYKVADSKLYERVYIQENAATGSWESVYEIRLYKNKLLVKSEKGISVYTALEKISL